jgi:hypothetical protein
VIKVLALLDGEQIAELDFDQLAVCLQESISVLEQSAQQDAELTVLRDDYIDRISGMRKATAAVSRNHDNLEEMLEYLDRLPELSSAELIKQYRVTSAGFRESFPASYGQLRTSRSVPAAGPDLSIYK